LSAINEESSTLPALLTDYILNGKKLHVGIFTLVIGASKQHVGPACILNRGINC